MRRILVLIASAAINASTIPAVAADCTSIKDIDAFRTRWELLRTQPDRAADKGNICRAYAASFYESVTLRQAAAKCIGDGAKLIALDSDINALNDLFASKCGG
ncbi:hypothetical protein [Bradyrhizobium sp. CCBAU 11361]|uniref:hypothetical protein n=1 Tax=Bradyrhizobium sp. CCBAU 11361 TaxID=1630812 RepID=UPI0023067DC7|nr:hypothetical protein [Bradyrhizobium sp. CCBAU 11361]MDA9492375.1 hypothetical protein [Bradyrhizobium sp. CCBAU 11361]